MSMNATARYFLHGFLVSLFNGIFISIIHASFYSLYIKNNPEMLAGFANLPPSISPRLGFASRVRNPTHGSGSIFQILSTKEPPEEGSESHQRKLVDCSDTFYSSCVKLHEREQNAV